MKRMALVFALAASLLTGTVAIAAVKAGATCTKVGATSIISSKKFTCIKSGKKLVWDKGTLVKKPTSVVPETPKSAPNASPTPTPTQLITLTSIEKYLSIDKCKILNANQNNDSNQSFSKRNIVPIDLTKPVRVLVFPADFSDLVSVNQSAPDFTKMKANFESYFESQSNGQIKFEWTVSPKFTRMSKTIASYQVGERAAGSVWQLNIDFQDLAFKTYAKKDFDYFIAIAPTSTLRTQIASSPAFPTRDDKYLSATYLGGDYWEQSDKDWAIPLHEFGHSLGLADLYDFSSSMLQGNGWIPQFQFMGVYDLMNYAGGSGLELTAWNRWLSKLIYDNQILCLPNQSVSLLKPIEELNNSVKGLVIPLSESKAIAIENRSAIGFDTQLKSGAQGVIVYLIDNSKETGNGPMRLIRKPGSTEPWFQDNALKKGESLITNDYEIKVLDVNKVGAYISVEKIN